MTRNQASPRENKIWRAGTLTYTTSGLVFLFLWLLGGDLGYNFKERCTWGTFQLLLRQFKASDFLLALLISTLPQIISVIVSPIIGYRSDRHRGRWGRRIPFLFVPTPIVALAMIGIAFSPAIGRWIHATAGGSHLDPDQSVLLSLGVFWIMFELCTIICDSIFNSLIADVVPKAVLGRFYGLFRVINLTAGTIFNLYIFGQAERYYVAIFVFTAAVYGVSFTLMCLKVKEGEYPPLPPVVDAGGIENAVSAVKTYFRECFSRPYYRWIFFAVTMGQLMVLPSSLYTIYFAKAVGMDMSTLGKYMVVQFSISALLSYPIGWLADKFHSTRVAIGGLILSAACALLAFFLVHDARTFGVAGVASGVLAGVWYTIVMGPFGAMLFPKLKFATFSSAMRLMYSAAIVGYGPACGWFLDHVVNHDYRYIYLWSFVPAVLALLATIVVYRKFMTYGGPKGYAPPE